MRILFTSILGSGHLSPLLPFATEMARRGHDLRVAVPEGLRDKVEQAGLGHVPVERPSDEDRNAFFAQYRHIPPLEFNKLIGPKVFAELLPERALPAQLAFAREWRPHLIVREASEYAAPITAELTGTPHIRVSISNGHSMTNFFEPADALRARHGLAPDGGAALRAARAFSAFPAAMEPENGDGADLPQFRVAPSVPKATDAPPDWVTPGGAAHLYMTFGTVMGSSDEAKQTFRAALAAVGAIGLPTLMTTGPSMDVGALGEIPANITLRDFAPQDEVFPHVTAMLSHGGSGTVLGALAAGLPQLVTPIGADQPDNAAAVARIGAGLAVDNRDAAEIETALRRVLAEPGFREAAQRTAAEMAASPSLLDAVDEMLRHALPEDARP